MWIWIQSILLDMYRIYINTIHAHPYLNQLLYGKKLFLWYKCYVNCQNFLSWHSYLMVTWNRFTCGICIMNFLYLSAWNTLWPLERKRQRAFFLFGLALILQLDIGGIRTFFRTFFCLPDWYDLFSLVYMVDILGFAL